MNDESQDEARSEARSEAEVLGDPRRLAALASTGLFQGAAATVAEGVFDRLASLARRVLGVPVALISFISEEEVFFAGAAGGPAGVPRHTPLTHSFCREVVIGNDLVVVADVRLDMTRQIPAVLQYDVLGYCGVPLTVEGQVVGAFCALDGNVRDWSEADVSALRDLAALAEREIELLVAQRREALVPARFMSLLNAIPAGIYVCDSDSRLVFFNDRAADVWGEAPPLGVRSSEAFAARRRTWPDGTPVEPEDTPDRAALLAQSGAGPTEFVLEDGSGAMVVLASAEPLRSAAGELAGAVGVLQDVTPLWKASKLRDELLALVSHELRTPLTIIAGMTSYLARYPEIPAEAHREATTEIAAAGRRMVRVVENMLQLSLFDEDASHAEPLLAQQLIDETLAAHAAQFPSGQVEQVGRRPHAMVSAVQTWSVLALSNLLHNAEQYGDGREPHRVEVEEREDEVQLRVCNSGEVLSEGEYEALFEPFFRRPSVRATIPGAGLGLTTARRLAEAQGGRLLAAPRPDHGGSMFTLALPAFVEDALAQG